MGKILQSEVSLERSVMQTTIEWAKMRSKDPSTRVGACIYDAETGSLHLGYNGFPKGVEDEERFWEARSAEYTPNKYDLVIHAEKNALLKALKAGSRPRDMHLFCTHAPCAQCWRDVIAAIGIRKVRVLIPTYPSRTKRDDDVGEFFIRKLSIDYSRIELL